MKAKYAAEAVKLENIPNIGKSLAGKLRSLGITKPDELKDKDAVVLYKKLNKLTGQVHDPCVLDIFMAAVEFMNGGKKRAWWEFTPKRKKLMENGGV